MIVSLPKSTYSQTRSRAGPRSDSVREAIGVRPAVDDALQAEAKLPGRVDSVHAVNTDVRRAVDIDDLVLAVLRVLAGGRVTLGGCQR